MTHPPVTRRVLLAAGAGASAAALAACSSPAPHPESTGAAGSSLVPPGTVLLALADVPVGGSVSTQAAGHPLLIAQLSAGTVVAYSAICTHQGCVVAARGTQFDCPCHGSQFEAATGAVLSGPAPRPLTPVAVRVSGDNVESGA
jgi:cytochrome b6-f complex iron-sulfur subunit